MHIKKISLILLTAAVLMTGCSQKQETPAPAPAETPAEQPAEAPAEEPAKEVSKLGLGHVISIAKSKDATDEKEGTAQVDSTVAAVKLDENGVIVEVNIDTLQTKVSFDKNGVVTSDKEAEQKSKKELGDDYGMRAASGIGKEWFEQIAELEKWMTGKTIDEVNAMKIEENVPAEEDLKSSVTIKVGDYISAVNEAVETAGEATEATETKLGLGHTISIAKSKDVADGKDGNAQVDSVVAAVQVDENGVITAVNIDTLQTKVGFNGQGAVTADLTAEQKSKKELGNDYGMKAVSSIGKEWFEQIAELEKWMVGKTIDEVNGMKIEENVPAEEDLKSTVTIKVNDYLTTVTEAVNNAK